MCWRPAIPPALQSAGKCHCHATCSLHTCLESDPPSLAQVTGLDRDAAGPGPATEPPSAPTRALPQTSSACTLHFRALSRAVGAAPRPGPHSQGPAALGPGGRPLPPRMRESEMQELATPRTLLRLKKQVHASYTVNAN